MTQQCEARARDIVGSCRVCQAWNQDAIDFDELSSFDLELKQCLNQKMLFFHKTRRVMLPVEGPSMAPFEAQAGGRLRGYVSLQGKAFESLHEAQRKTHPAKVLVTESRK